MLHNPHVQTVLPRFHNRANSGQLILQELSLPDGDFIDLAWTAQPQADSRKPIVIIFHGLEGSAQSPYAQGLLRAVTAQGWQGVVMHYRGCSGRPNRLARSYHSGDTADARYFIEWLQQQYPAAPLAAVGYSLGGNMLLKLQAEWGKQSPLQAAVSVSAPLQLASCSNRLQQGFSRLYQRHLLRSLKAKVLAKFAWHDYQALIGLSRQRLLRLTSFWEFDDVYTAPVHGFADVHDYYRRASARQYLGAIHQPALIIHALDDPFMTRDILPEQGHLPPAVQLCLTRRGGHVGFVQGSPWKPVYWLEQVIPAYLKNWF